MLLRDVIRLMDKRTRNNVYVMYSPHYKARYSEFRQARNFIQN